MNYQKIYDSLIERGRNRILKEYSETHHILPRCMGGSDDSQNLVNLTPEEHYLAHQLLVKMHPDNISLVKAAAMMIPSRPSNKMYGWLRRRFSEAQSECQSGNGNSQFGTKWITNGVIEKKISSKDPIPNGWKNQRLSSYLKEIERIKKRKIKEREKKEKLKIKVQELRILYQIYKESGFEGVKGFGYQHSKPNLVSAFVKYLPEFVPQNGKKRKV